MGSVYTFCLIFTYRFNKEYDVIKIFLISFLLNLLLAIFIKRRFLAVFIYTIGFNILYAMVLLSYGFIVRISRTGIENFFSNISVYFIFEGLWFHFLAILLSGNWMLPFIKLCLKKIFTYVSTFRENKENI